MLISSIFHIKIKFGFDLLSFVFEPLHEGGPDPPNRSRLFGFV